MQSKFCLSCGSKTGLSTSLVAVHAFLTWRHERIGILGGLEEPL